MLEEAEKHKDEDDLMIAERLARENLREFLDTSRVAIDTTPESNISDKDRFFIDRKWHETSHWLMVMDWRATREECEQRQQALEMAWDTMLKKMSGEKIVYPWEKFTDMPDEGAMVSEGGYYLENGTNLREFFDEPD